MISLGSARVARADECLNLVGTGGAYASGSAASFIGLVTHHEPKTDAE